MFACAAAAAAATVTAADTGIWLTVPLAAGKPPAVPQATLASTKKSRTRATTALVSAREDM